jgi:hypothetical protein
MQALPACLDEDRSARRLARSSAVDAPLMRGASLTTTSDRPQDRRRDDSLGRVRVAAKCRSSRDRSSPPARRQSTGVTLTWFQCSTIFPSKNLKKWKSFSAIGLPDAGAPNSSPSCVAVAVFHIAT